PGDSSGPRSPRCSSSRSSIRICERSLPQIRSGAWRRKRKQQQRPFPASVDRMRPDDTNYWRPSRTAITALLMGLVVLLAIAFLACYLPLQRREAALRAEASAQEKGLPRLTVMYVKRESDQADIKLTRT